MSEAAAAQPREIAVAGPSSLVPQQSPGATMISMIDRAIRDPSVDMDKLDRLMAYREKEMAREEERAFDSAIALAERKMKKVIFDKANAQTRSKYASYARLDGDIRGIYTEHGFGISYDTDVSPKGTAYLRVYAYVTQDGGHKRTYKYDVPIVTKGPKGNDVMTETHATQSAFTYGKRALLGGIFNVTVGEDDDDGNAAGGSAQGTSTITDTQAKEIYTLLEESDTDLDKFLAYGKVECVEDIPVKQFASAKAMLEKKKQLKAERDVAAKEAEKATEVKQ